jgi:hypothetical protein
MALTKLTEDICAANEALVSMRGHGARWWNFSVSHTKFNIVVGDPLGEDNVVLCLPGCGYLAGPVQWPNQQIEIVVVDDCTVIQDQSVGFRAEDGRLRWRRNYDLWTFQGICAGRGDGGRGIDDITEKVKKWLARYFGREIGFAEVAYQINGVLWYCLPASGKHLDH